MLKVTACSVCSLSFSYERPDGQSGRLRRYCGDTCRKSAQAERERIARGRLRDCCVCGESFYTYATSENPCCSKSCIANFGWSAKPVRVRAERPLLENKCVICSAPLRYAVWGGRPVETCPSKACKRERDNQRTKQNYVPVRHDCVCVICSRKFVSRRSGAKFCGRVCAAKQQTLKRRETGQASRYNYTKQLTCERCGSRFYGKLRQRFCGMSCSNAFAREVAVAACVESAKLRKKDRQQIVLFTGQKSAPETPVTVLPGGWWCAGDCAVCGSSFVSRHSDKTCSPDCRKAFYARKKQKVPLNQRTRSAVYERDALVCQICMEPTDPGADPISNWFPSLDHIIPRSKGGDDSVENLRTAHRWCNSVLSDGRYYTDLDLRAA